MQRTHNKSKAEAEKTVLPKNCFVEKVKNWVWLIVIITVVSIVYVIVTSSARKPVYSSISTSFPQVGKLQNVTLTRCPYCPGFLDAQGRCNISECPVYSPNWGKPLERQSIPVKQVLIKQLALEVGASEGKSSVVIQSVYGGGNGEKAKLHAGDRIYRFNGRKVRSVKQFKSIVARAKPESNVRIQVIRNGEKIDSFVRIGEGEMEGVSLPKTRG